MVKLTKALTRNWIVPLLCAIPWAPLRAQTVAETIKALKADVNSLKGGSVVSLPEGIGTMKHVAIGDGFASFSNLGGKEVVNVGRSGGADGQVTLNRSTGDVGAQINASEFGGIAIFFDTGGRQAVYIGVDTTGQGTLRINGDRKFDYAEVFDISSRSGILPGSVVTAAPDGTGMELASFPYDRRVIGVVAGAGGLSSGIRTGTRTDGTSDLAVAVAGQVYVRICDENGSVEVGDLLVSSNRPGVAMRAKDMLPGTIIGKALQQYTSGSETKEGLVRMLVMNH